MIKFDSNIRLFRTSGIPGLCPLCAWLSANCPDFGNGVRRIYVTLVLPYKGEYSASTQQNLGGQFKDYLAKFRPGQIRTRLSPKNRTIEIEMVADFILASEFLEMEYPDYEFQISAHALWHRALQSCRNKFESPDDFQFDEFITWFEKTIDGFPRTGREMNQLVRDFTRRRNEAFITKSEWEKLDVDWSLFHPRARELVTDPGLWSRTNDFAPNGNDTGFDVLHTFKQNKGRHREDGGSAIYRKLCHDWDVNRNAGPGDEDYREKRLIIFGLAFSFLKFFGYCPDWLATEAVQQVVDFKKYIADVDPGWAHKRECFEYYDSMIACLENCPTEPTTW